jgi:hypothetical protein
VALSEGDFATAAPTSTRPALIHARASLREQYPKRESSASRRTGEDIQNDE